MTPIQQMLLGAGESKQIVTDNLELFYDFGNTSCYNNTENHTSYDTNVIILNNLAKSAHSNWRFGLSFYGINFNGNNQTPSYYVTTQSGNGGYIRFNENMTSASTVTSDFPILYQRSLPLAGLGYGDWTLEFWYDYYKFSGRDQYIYLMRDSSDYQGTLQVGFHANTTGGLSHLRLQLFSQYYNESTSAYNYGYHGLNGWDHLVISSRSGTVRIYHNNVNTSTTYRSFNYVEDWNAGSNFNGCSLFDVNAAYRYTGKFAIYRIYKNKGLTAAEVDQNFEAERGRFGV
tara:strand:+ start:521 stop:1381 length:861 start_codon:yes stop_codon:yes gene_type:complete